MCCACGVVVSTSRFCTAKCHAHSSDQLTIRIKNNPEISGYWRVAKVRHFKHF